LDQNKHIEGNRSKMVDFSSSKAIIFETSNAFSRRLIVTFIKPNANYPFVKINFAISAKLFAREK
jgi:hypothetical protein